MELGATILLIPLVCFLPAQVAWNTHPEVFAAAKRIVIKAMVGRASTVSRDQQGGTMTLHPVDFHMHTNPVGCSAAFLTKTVKYLKSREETLAPGVIHRLAQRYNLPDLGDKIYNLVLSTHLFEPRTLQISKKIHESRINEYQTMHKTIT